jgi:uncharacterized membrane protein YhhN
MASTTVRTGVLIALACSAAVAAVTFLVGLDHLPKPTLVALKVVPCAAMAVAVWMARPGRAGLLVAAGLVLSAVGDVLLELPFDLFVPGLIAFLVAHLLYIAGLSLQWPRLAPLRALPFFAWVAAVFVHLQSGLGPLAVPVAVYCVVIGAMGWRASAGVTTTDRVAQLALVGAILFVASDTILALNKFGTPFDGARIANLSAYWGGQALLCVAGRRFGARKDRV